jgi:hypothetical protein
MKMRLLAATAAVLVYATTSFGATITNGNASLNILDTVFSNNSGNGTLLAETPQLFGSGPAGQNDQLFQYTWYYRQPTLTTRFFSSLDTPVVSSVGDTMTITYTNAGAGVAGFARMNAQFTIKLVDGSSPNSLRVDTSLVFQSHPGNATTQTFQLFNLLDLDLYPTVTNDTIAVLDNNGVTTRQTDPGGSIAEYMALGANRYQLAAGSTLRTAMNGGSNNFATAAGTSATNFAGDAAVGAQWTLTLAPGESRTIRQSFTINQIVPEPSSLGLLVPAGMLLARRRK